MLKKNTPRYKEIIRCVKEQIKEEENVSFIKQIDKSGTAPRELGLTKKQALKAQRRNLIRQERRQRYDQILANTYESGLKFEYTSKEHYGSMMRLNDKVNSTWLRKNGVSAGAVMLLINSSSSDIGKEGRSVQTLSPLGNILDVRASWLDVIR